MIQGEYEETDLEIKKYELLKFIPDEFKNYVSNNDELICFEYPMLKYPEKIKSINMDKNKDFEGILTGIKGQYLIFDNEYVLNVRKYTGYIFNLKISD